MEPNQAPSKRSAVPHVFPVAAAYVKPVEQQGQRVYAIHDQHGTPVALAQNRDLAFAFLAQQNLNGTDAH